LPVISRADEGVMFAFGTPKETPQPREITSPHLVRAESQIAVIYWDLW
jgi:hypothetical protein